MRNRRIFCTHDSGHKIRITSIHIERSPHSKKQHFATLPNDARKLHVRKSYELKMEPTSFAVLGFGYAEARVTTYQFNQYPLVLSPIISSWSKTISKTMHEAYLLEKNDVSKSIIRTYSGTMPYFISGNWCSTEFNSISWSICEEK